MRFKPFHTINLCLVGARERVGTCGSVFFFVSGSVWERFLASGGVWENLGASGNVFSRLGAYGNA